MKSISMSFSINSGQGLCFFPSDYTMSDANFMCYYCNKCGSDSHDILTHELKNHCDNSNAFTVRVRRLDQSTGNMEYVSQHYGIKLCDIKLRLESGSKVIIDTDEKKVRFKQTNNPETESIPQQVSDSSTESDEVLFERMRHLLPDVMKILKESNREKYFISMLECLVSGKLSVHNISLNLLLDLAQYLNLVSSGQMRYSQTSLDFWLIVKKLFKGKGIRFFSGCKTNVVKKRKEEDEGKVVETIAESVINFAVPSRPILDKQSEKYKINAETPGILKGALDAFVESKGKDVECKISIDGKNLHMDLVDI